MMIESTYTNLTVKNFSYSPNFVAHRITKCVLSIAGVLLLSVLISAVNPINAQQVGNFIHLDKRFQANSMIESDSFGNILVSTSAGIDKYNGYDFDLIPLTEIIGPDYINDVGAILEKDKEDRFWFTTYRGGLTRLDVNGQQLQFGNSLSKLSVSSRITAIGTDSTYVWLGSANGTLHRFQYSDSTFKKIVTLPSLLDTTQVISNIAITSSDQLWMSTEGGKIYGYNTTLNQLEELEGSFTNSLTNYVRLVTDRKNRLWISTELMGIYAYDPLTKHLDEIPTYNTASTPGRYPMFYSLFCDSQGNVWAGTDGDGLYKFGVDEQIETILRQNDRNKFSLSDNTISHINEDANGNLWIVTKNGDIDILPNYNNRIEYHTGTASNVPATVLCLLKSSDGSLWIGTDGKGLNRVLTDGTSRQYGNGISHSRDFTGRYIQRLVEGASGKIWIATYQNGLYTYDPVKDTFAKLVVTGISEQAHTDFRFLFEDVNERIWATTIAGVHVFSEDEQLLATFPYRANGLQGSMSESIYQTADSSLWIGTDRGLFRFNENLADLQKSTFKKITYYQKNEEDFDDYSPLYMTDDSQGNLWICSSSGLLTCLQPNDMTYTSYGDHPQLQGISASALLFDESDNMWLSSRNGLHQYDVETDSLQSYYMVDGLQGDSFVRKSAFKSKNGLLYFGGEEGVNGFHPDSISATKPQSNLYVQKIEILNKSAKSLIPDQLREGTENVKKLQLTSDQSSFSFQFAAIGNLLNPNYHYAYRLGGFDTDWIYPESQRVATYTNIPSGQYNFEVKAGTKKGIWDVSSRQIAISVAPPWWQSNLAYVSYGLATLSFIFGIMLWVRLKNRMSREEFLFSKEKELYALKMNFFAKMSHEIQTPLTLIMAPIDDMLQGAKSNGNNLLNQRLTLIKNNAQRLSRISAELMTIRNKELNQLSVYPEKRNVILDIDKIAESFAEHAQFKNISFTQDYPKSEILLWYDIEKIEHVFYNLLSNAFKFTPQGGIVYLSITERPDGQLVDISVTDSGPGIPTDEREDIFELFYQSDVGKQAKGQGIGLALSKELVDLHRGKIEVSSSEKGTCFIVSLKTGDIFSTQEKSQPATVHLSPSQRPSKTLTVAEKLGSNAQRFAEKRGTILVVEDNVEMQIFLRDLFSPQFYVLVAENGREGIDFARKKSPDVIVSDVMMPIMDGISMSKKLLKSKATAHMPILLLTAKNTAESKLSGFSSGAIAYIQKPFDPYELVLRVNNILDNKEKTIVKHQSDVLSVPHIAEIQSKDEQFIEQLASELNKQLENAEFRLEDLAGCMNMSYSGIYRRCQQVVGKTPLEYFKTLKLKYALILIVENGYNISEAAFMVGYKDPKYFTKCFKNEFGTPPILLKKEYQKIGLTALAKKYHFTLPQQLVKITPS